MEFQVLIKRALLLCATLPMWAGCTERIDINTRDAAPRLVIYGHISSQMDVHPVRITRSTGYFSTETPGGISGAEVSISYQGTTYMLYEDPTEKGTYRPLESFAGIPGETYTLDVAVDFRGEGRLRHYRATSYMPNEVNVTDLKLEPSAVFRDFVEVLLSAQLPQGKDDSHYSVHVWVENQLVNDSLSQFTMFDRKNLSTDELIDVPCFYLDQQDLRTRLRPGDRVTVGVDAITAAYADFLHDAREEASASIPFFSGPPANISTNITALDADDDTPLSGFFTAYPRTLYSTIYGEDF